MPSIDWYGSINEAYIGKTKDILAMEKAIHDIRSNHLGDIYFANADTSEFNRLAEKVFGFKVFALYIFPSNVRNAFTLPIDVKLDVNTLNKKNNLCDKSGFKYRKDAGYCCTVNISSGIIFSEDFTDGEVMAIILHEIGHNFSSMVDNGIKINQFIIKYVFSIMQLLEIINGNFHNGITINLNSYDKLKINIEEYLKNKCPHIIQAMSVLRGIKGFALDIVTNIFALLSAITPTNVIRSIIRSLSNLIYKPTGYNNEKIADNFPTIYGYGSELSSALLKFEYKQGIVTTDFIATVPLIGDIIALRNIGAEIIVSAFDEHPIWIERSQDQIRLLEDELNKSSLDPKMKKVIINDINQIKKSQDKYLSTYSDTHNSNIYKRMWYSFIFDMNDGDIKHKMIGRKNFKNIDKTLSANESTKLLEW